ncbi:MAG: 5-formyltetrahydrofolate cyclo-ligase [Candidatus Puniceispirillaceae bacterium]
MPATPPPCDPQSIDEAKARLRKDAANRRARLAEHSEAQSQALAERADSFMSRFSPQSVAGYWPVRSELDIRPFLSALQVRGVRLCLPITGPAGTALSFHAWDYGAELDQGRYNIQQPFAEADQLAPDVICVPLLAFDGNCHRLGYGGGYYDRTLAALRGDGHQVTAIGMAYSAQEMDQLVIGPYDQPLDDVLTPQGWRRARDANVNLGR